MACLSEEQCDEEQFGMACLSEEQCDEEQCGMACLSEEQCDWGCSIGAKLRGCVAAKLRGGAV